MTTPNLESALNEALALASQGISVFPCYSDKRPVCPHSFKDASADPNEVRKLWEKYPGPLIGVPTGSVNGFDALDIDPRHGGDKWLEKNAGNLPITRIHITRSGGSHYFFRHHPGLRNSTNKVAAGVDIRAEGGYVICWPAFGLATRSEDLLADWPDWLLQLASTQSKKTSSILRPEDTDFDMRLQQAAEEVSSTPEGARNDTLYREVLGVSRHAKIITVMEAAGKASGLPLSEVKKTVISAMRGAEARFLNSPIMPFPSSVDLIRGDQVELREIGWLWKEWLARGKLHMLAGMPGTGKTTIALSLAATLTKGDKFPDGTSAPVGDVLIWSGEDDPADTLAPRLMAMGADMTRIHFIGNVKDGQRHRPFDPATDLPVLGSKIEEINPVMLVVDPIVSAVNADSHKNTETRRALQPIVDLASKFNMAVLGISHLSKGSTGRNPLERVIGSTAFAAMPRVVFVAAKKESGESNGRIFCRAKSNIGPDNNGFEYTLQDRFILERPGLSPSCVVWERSIIGDARKLLTAAEATDSNNCLEEAKCFLIQIIGEEIMSAKDIKAAAQQAGISDATLRRAKESLGVMSKRDGKNKTWGWCLPGNGQGAQDTHLQGMSILGEGEHVEDYEIPN